MGLKLARQGSVKREQPAISFCGKFWQHPKFMNTHKYTNSYVDTQQAHRDRHTRSTLNSLIPQVHPCVHAHVHTCIHHYIKTCMCIHTQAHSFTLVPQGVGVITTTILPFFILPVWPLQVSGDPSLPHLALVHLHHLALAGNNCVAPGSP